MRSPATARQLLRYLPVLPAVLLLLVFLAGPVLWAFHASLTDAGLTGRSARNPSWVGLENYQRLLTDPVFPLSVLLTVVFVAGSAVLGQNLLGLALAVLMRRARPLVSAVVGTTVVAAWVLPEIVAAFAAYAYFSGDGTLNQLLGGLGFVRQDWLYAFPMVAVMLANVWRGTAFSMLVYRAALNEVPAEVTEAAQMDGAHGWQRFAFHYAADDPGEHHHQPDADHAADPRRLHARLGDDSGRAGQRQHHTAGPRIPGGLQVR